MWYEHVFREAIPPDRHTASKPKPWFATRGEAIRTAGSILQVLLAITMLAFVVRMR